MFGKIILLWVALIIGWIINTVQVVIKLQEVGFSELSGYYILKGVTILLGPIGSVMGYIGIFIS